MNRISVFDEFGNWMGDFMPAESFEGCLGSIFFVILMIIFWTAGFLVFLLFKLLINGFKSLFQGKIGMAILYWIIPIILFWIIWTYGFKTEMKALASIPPESINGYFIFPDKHPKECETYNLTMLGFYGESHPVPDQFLHDIVQEVWCWRDFIPAVRYFKFKNTTTLQDYINWIQKNGISGTKLIYTRKTEEGIILGLEGHSIYNYKSYPGSIIIWSVDKYAFVGQLDAMDTYGTGGMPLNQLEESWLATYSQHR